MDMVLWCPVEDEACRCYETISNDADIDQHIADQSLHCLDFCKYKIRMSLACEKIAVEL